MPYIKKSDRKGVYPAVEEIFSSPGELNFAFTVLIQKYLFDRGEAYQTYNDIIGALEGAKLELYRRKIGDYETKKIYENGDVY